jgi:hypothetical protein
VNISKKIEAESDGIDSTMDMPTDALELIPAWLFSLGFPRFANEGE